MTLVYYDGSSQYHVQVGGFSKTMKYGTRNNSSVPEATTYDREGYTLQGWYNDKNCAGTKVFDSSGKAVYASGYWSASHSNGGVWRYNPSDHGGLYTVSLYACWVAN